MDFKPNPDAHEALLKMARPKLQLACASLVNYIKGVKLAKGRRELGDFLGAGDAPHVKFGTLRDSVTQRWKEGDPNTQQVGSSVRHARVQELGMTISSGKSMTIPLTYEAVLHMNKPGATARTFPRHLDIFQSRRNPGIFFLYEYRRGGPKNPKRTEIHFILAKRVVIKPHPWLVPSLHEHAGEMLKIMGGTG